MAEVNMESKLVSNTIADKEKQDNEATSNNTSNKRPLPSTSDTAASPTQQQTCPQDDHLPVAKKARSEQPGDEISSPATTAAVITSPSTIAAAGGGTIKPATSIFGSSTSSGFAAFGSSATPSSFFGSSTTTTGFGLKSSAFTSTSTGFGTAAAAAAAASNSNAIPTTNTNNYSTSATLPSTFNANAEGFPSSTSTLTSNPITGIFGSTSIFTLGNSNENNNQEASSSTSSPNKSSNNPIVSLPINEEPVRNGEENEEAIITLRAKLFKLIKVQEKLVDDRPVKSPSDAQSKKTGIQMATKVGESAEEADGTTTAAAAAATTMTTTATDSNAHSATDSGKMDWKEVGIGPLRVLTDQRHARIVQRRENTPGGQGTKLILNLALRDECQVERKGDKFVKLAAFEVVDDSKEEANDTIGNDSVDKESKDRDEDAIEDGKDDPAVKFESVQYLFKVKTIAEADSLVETLARYCRSSAATKD